jgi:hypothetical protein
LPVLDDITNLSWSVALRCSRWGSSAGPTKDVDVIAFLDDQGRPLSGGTDRRARSREPRLRSASRVAQFWPGRAHGSRAPGRLCRSCRDSELGPGLTVHFASRLDQIHFKLYALVDQGVGKHEQDLRALHPTTDELIQAARWTRTHDPSVGFREMLDEALRYLGVEDADLGA